jgi:hypothetical protein
MEECNIAYLVSLKCEARKHYKSICLMCQRCWLLCPSCSEYRKAITCEDLKGGALKGYFYSAQIAVNKEYSCAKYDTLLHV